MSEDEVPKDDAHAPAPRGFRRGEIGWVAGVLIVCALLWVPRWRGPMDLRYDAGVYYILGASIAEGHGYRLLNEPGEIHAVQYPPGLPLVVAAHVKALGTSDVRVVGPELRTSYFVLFIVYLLSVYALARRFVSPPVAFLACMITGCFEHTMLLSDLLFAEIPFALMIVLFVMADLAKSSRWRLASGLFAIAAYLLRTAGIALLIAWVLECLPRRQYRIALLRAAIALVPIIAWNGYIYHVEHSSGYTRPAYAYQRAPYMFYNVSYATNMKLLDPFNPEKGTISRGTMAVRALRNATGAIGHLGESVSEPRRGWFWILSRVEGYLKKGGVHLLSDEAWTRLWTALSGTILFMLGCIPLIGLGVLGRRGQWLIPLSVAGSIALICLTPWGGQFSRYPTPIVPLVTIGFCIGLIALRDAARRSPSLGAQRGATIGVGIVIALIVFLEGYVLIHAFLRSEDIVTYTDARGLPQQYRVMFYNDDWRAFDAAVPWLREHGQPGDVVATVAPHWVYLHTGLKAVMTPMEIDPDREQAMLDSAAVRYLVVDNMDYVDTTARYAAPMIKTHAGQWWPVYRSPDNPLTIYERVRSEAPAVR